MELLYWCMSKSTDILWSLFSLSLISCSSIKVLSCTLISFIFSLFFLCSLVDVQLDHVVLFLFSWITTVLCSNDRTVLICFHGQQTAVSWNNRKHKWHSIVGGVLDWMLFFFKCWQLVSTSISGNQIQKGSWSRSGVPLWEGLLIRCSSFSNIDNLSVWISENCIWKRSQSVPLWEVFLIGCSSFSNSQQVVLSWKWHKVEVVFHLWEGFLMGCSFFSNVPC